MKFFKLAMTAVFLCDLASARYSPPIDPDVSEQTSSTSPSPATTTTTAAPPVSSSTTSKPIYVTRMTLPSREEMMKYHIGTTEDPDYTEPPLPTRPAKESPEPDFEDIVTDRPMLPQKRVYFEDEKGNLDFNIVIDYEELNRRKAAATSTTTTTTTTTTTIAPTTSTRKPSKATPPPELDEEDEGEPVKELVMKKPKQLMKKKLTFNPLTEEEFFRGRIRNYLEPTVAASTEDISQKTPAWTPLVWALAFGVGVGLLVFCSCFTCQFAYFNYKLKSIAVEAQAQRRDLRNSAFSV